MFIPRVDSVIITCHDSRWRLQARKQFSNYNWTDEKIERITLATSTKQRRIIQGRRLVRSHSHRMCCWYPLLIWYHPALNGIFPNETGTQIKRDRETCQVSFVNSIDNSHDDAFYSGIVNISTRERCNEGKSISDSKSTILPHSAFCVFLIR